MAGPSVCSPGFCCHGVFGLGLWMLTMQQESHFKVAAPQLQKLAGEGKQTRFAAVHI